MNTEPPGKKGLGMPLNGNAAEVESESTTSAANEEEQHRNGSAFTCHSAASSSFNSGVDGGDGVPTIPSSEAGEQHHSRRSPPPPETEAEVAAAPPPNDDDLNGDVDDDGGAGGGKEEASDRPIQFDDNYYEIEAVRRKRVHKGQLQYLIKWRGWPETANTWEPLDNLLGCSDVIDAFEESLKAGKQRKRKRKSSWASSIVQPKKKKQQILASCSNNKVNLRVCSESVPSGTQNSFDMKDLGVASECSRPLFPEEENRGNAITRIEIPKQAAESVPLNLMEAKEDTELNTKIIELKGVTTHESDADKFAVHLQQAKASEGGCIADGLSNVECVEPVQTNRCTGSRRRKSGSVRRFKQESILRAPNEAWNEIGRTNVGSWGATEQTGTENPNSMGLNLSHRQETNSYKDTFSINEIIKPIGYSASVSNNVQDVLVTFAAMRSDGKEVTVDNRYLKANNPLLLINFYEQHLRYSSTT